MLAGRGSCQSCNVHVRRKRRRVRRKGRLQGTIGWRGSFAVLVTRAGWTGRDIMGREWRIARNIRTKEAERN